MLEIKINAGQAYDDQRNEFIEVKDTVIRLEHSLLSLAKWEAIHEKPYLNRTDLTAQESLDYIHCMCLDKNVDKNALMFLTREQIQQIRAYIDKPMTATTIQDRRPKTGRSETITSEIIYYWMISLGIPIEFEKWHLNRLLTLIRICDIKNSNGTKMPRDKQLSEQRMLNAQRRAKLHSKG